MELKKVVFLIFIPFLFAFSNEKPFLSKAEIVPHLGTVRHGYTAKVFYYDPDGDVPTRIEVVIDGVPYPLKFKKGTPSHGWYQSVKLTLPPGEHKYYFYCEDGRGKYDRYPRYGEKTGPLVGLVKRLNRKPKLSEGGVYFESGTEYDLYTFTVRFYDPDCLPPRSVIVFIDGIPCTMRLHKGKRSDGIYLAKRYLKVGPHTYYFVAEDYGGEKVSLPEEGFIRGPKVEEALNADPLLTDCAVTPNLGGPGAIFTFSCFYRDEDKDPPAIIQVFINNRPYTMRLIEGKRYEGVYILKKRLPQSKFHTYYFYCEDGRGGIKRVPEKGAFHGPVILK